jgi:hypothetical protein
MKVNDANPILYANTINTIDLLFPNESSLLAA